MAAVKILPIIIIAQFFCTSLWFAGNAVLPDLISYHFLSQNILASITSSVQLGFITGTLCFALLTISDRFHPSKIFFTCAIIAAGLNTLLIIHQIGYSTILLSRFFTGFFLAGIYPVGMKIAADYFDKSLGKALGYLVGALVLGTALPHLLKAVTTHIPWKYVAFITSFLSIIGGSLILLFVPAGPFRKRGSKLQIKQTLKIFSNKKFSQAAFGYFGHMWELYTFWAFVPVILNLWKVITGMEINTPLYTFIIIASGAIGCVFAGLLSVYIDSKTLAITALSISGICCLLSPFIFNIPSSIILIVFLIIWGLSVVADSPLFSSLAANNAPVELKGTALTLMNCIGFSITIISIQFINYLQEIMDTRFIFMFLSMGPITALIILFRSIIEKPKNETC